MFCCLCCINCSWQKKNHRNWNRTAEGAKKIWKKNTDLESSAVHLREKVYVEFQCHHLCKKSNLNVAQQWPTWWTAPALSEWVQILSAKLPRRKMPRKSVIPQTPSFRGGKQNLNKTTSFWPHSYTKRTWFADGENASLWKLWNWQQRAAKLCTLSLCRAQQEQM